MLLDSTGDSRPPCFHHNKSTVSMVTRIPRPVGCGFQVLAILTILSICTYRYHVIDKGSIDLGGEISPSLGLVQHKPGHDDTYTLVAIEYAFCTNFFLHSHQDSWLYT